jgi:hypothetical protein
LLRTLPWHALLLLKHVQVGVRTARLWPQLHHRRHKVGAATQQKRQPQQLPRRHAPHQGGRGRRKTVQEPQVLFRCALYRLQ